MAKDYYEILGVSKDASQDDIKKAFRNLSKKYHPDRHVNDSEEEKNAASEKFKEINEANSILSDPEKRKMYDNGGFSDNMGGFEGFARGFGGFNPFDMAWGGFGGGQRVAKGTDVRVDLTVSFKEAFFGGEKKEIQIPLTRVCKHCGGTGSESKKPKQCPQCNGTGRVVRESVSGFTHFRTEYACPNCGGNGYIIDDPCTACVGSGVETYYEKTYITLPAGLFEGATLVLNGHGNEPDLKGRDLGISTVRGDVHIVVHVQADKNFKRTDDNNLIQIVNISSEEGILGAKKEVEILDGSKHTINIKPFTDSGQIVGKMTGRGFQRLGGGPAGDLFFEVRYEKPKNLTEEQKELLKEFFKIENQK